MHEDIPIFNYLVPKEFTHENGKLTGVVFEKVKAVRDAKGRRNLVPTGEPDQHFPCDDVLVAVGQENAFPWIERDMRHRVRQMGHAEGRHRRPWRRPIRKCSSAATPRSARRTSSGRWRTATRPRSRSTSSAAARTSMSARRRMIDHRQPEDGHPRVELRQRDRARQALSACRTATKWWRYATSRPRSNSATTSISRSRRPQRCLNCDVQTVFTGQLCIECDACVDICPMDCITFTENGEEADLRTRLEAPATNPTQDLYVANSLKTGRVMVKDEDVCLHCGLCAERCPDRRLGHAEISRST